MGDKVKSFVDLYAWQKGHSLVLQVYKLTEKFPADERFGLISQLRRAVVSITSNIAEGFRRNTSKDKIRFYSIALASLSEVQNQLIVARDIRYITNEEFRKIADISVEVGKLMSGLIKSAETRKF